MPFTQEELAEMARADAEIEASFHLTKEDLARSRIMDREAVVASMLPEKRKLAEYQRAYREANRDKVAEYQRAYYEANREVNRSVAYALKTARKSHGYTQKDLARLLGISRSLLAMWETGMAAPNMDKLSVVLPELKDGS